MSSSHVLRGLPGARGGHAHHRGHSGALAVTAPFPHGRPQSAHWREKLEERPVGPVSICLRPNKGTAINLPTPCWEGRGRGDVWATAWRGRESVPTALPSCPLLCLAPLWPCSHVKYSSPLSHSGLNREGRLYADFFLIDAHSSTALCGAGRAVQG